MLHTESISLDYTTFSSLGRALEKHRGRLKLLTVDGLMFLHSLH